MTRGQDVGKYQVHINPVFLFILNPFKRDCLPVARAPDSPDNFLLTILQVSWSVPHKQASSGTYQVKFFDEEAYSALRKVRQIFI